jgi:hypothetical protein
VRRATLRGSLLGAARVYGRHWLARVRWHLKELVRLAPSVSALVGRTPPARALLAHLPFLRSRWLWGACALVAVAALVMRQGEPAPQLAGVKPAGLMIGAIGGGEWAPGEAKQAPGAGPAVRDDLSLPPAPSVAGLREGAGADVAFVVRDQGLEAVDASGRVVWRWDGALDAQSCALDAATDTVWWTTPEGEGAQVGLYVLDLRSPSRAVQVARGLPAEARWAVAHGDAPASLPADYTVGVTVRLSEAPALEASLGCEGDMAWFCYAGEPSQRRLNFDIEAAYRAARGAKLAHRGMLAKLGARAAQAEAPAWAPSGASADDVPARLQGISGVGCAAWPEDCGRVEPIAHTGLWAVVVGNDRGDLSHTFHAVYDPAAAQFIDLETGARQAHPTEGEELALVVSPSGARYLSEQGLHSFAGGAPLHGFDVACGWLGGGAPFGAR